VPNGTPTFGYDVHGSVSQLIDANGNSQASYGYKAYGQTDGALTQGDPDPLNPINPFPYSAKRTDTGSNTVDMGVRRFGPDVSRFLTPDLFFGALSNLSLSLDPITQNRYGLAGGNPISFKEWDGHVAVTDGGGGAATDPTTSATMLADPCSGPCQDGLTSENEGSQVCLPTLFERVCITITIPSLKWPWQSKQQEQKKPPKCSCILGILQTGPSELTYTAFIKSENGQAIIKARWTVEFWQRDNFGDPIPGGFSVPGESEPGPETTEVIAASVVPIPPGAATPGLAWGGRLIGTASLSDGQTCTYRTTS
jgi:RHS repeat-associated protein